MTHCIKKITFMAFTLSIVNKMNQQEIKSPATKELEPDFIWLKDVFLTTID